MCKTNGLRRKTIYKLIGFSTSVSLQEGLNRFFNGIQVAGECSYGTHIIQLAAQDIYIYIVRKSSSLRITIDRASPSSVPTGLNYYVWIVRNGPAF